MSTIYFSSWYHNLATDGDPSESLKLDHPWQKGPRLDDDGDDIAMIGWIFADSTQVAIDIVKAAYGRQVEFAWTRPADIRDVVQLVNHLTGRSARYQCVAPM